MIAAYIYRKVLEKLDLSKKDLQKLKNELKEEKICCGPFLKNDKMCPTTTALSIKLKAGKFKNSEIVSEKLRELGISKSRLYLFYLIFDLPAMISHKFFKRKLRDFRKVVDCLVKEK